MKEMPRLIFRNYRRKGKWHGKAEEHRPLSRGRRSAGLEKRAPLYADALLGAEYQRDALETGRHRQFRRLGHERSRGQKDRSADCAIIIVIAGILAGVLRRRFLWRLREMLRFGGGYVGGAGCTAKKHIAEVHIADMHVPDMDVPERQHELQHKRREPRPRTIAPMEPNPPHGQHANVTMLHLARGATHPAHLECGSERQPHRKRFDRMQSIVHDAVLADCVECRCVCRKADAKQAIRLEQRPVGVGCLIAA
jgi:hypothetical protein